MGGAERMARRIVHGIVLILAATLSLAACGSASSAISTQNSSTASTTQAPPTTTSILLPPKTTAPIPTQPNIVQSPVVSGPVVLRGNGIGSAVFGQPETTAISKLEKVLGPPTTATPRPTTNCTVDAYLQFPGIVIYFDRKTFVGYNTGPANTGSANTENGEILNVITTKGLKIGDTLAQAKQIYGSSLRTSAAQGGSWFASTSTGTLSGLTTDELYRTNPPPKIADISAGSVGCPAVSP